MIPHFEKMLYDNGPLLALCCDAHEATGDEPFREAAQETADWVLREMQSPEGGYYSSLDADREGHEGQVLCLDREDVRSLLERGRIRPRSPPCFGLDRAGQLRGALASARLSRRPRRSPSVRG